MIDLMASKQSGIVTVNGARFRIEEYCIPENIIQIIDRISNYFKEIDRHPVPNYYRRRMCYKEFSDLAITYFEKIARLNELNLCIMAGGAKISPIAWACFGRNSKGIARHYFSNITEVMIYYQKQFSKNYVYFELHHLCCAKTPAKIARLSRMYGYSVSSILVVAILLLYDLLRYCAPDCGEFFELFTNDYRDTSDSVDSLSWYNTRQRLFDHPNSNDRTSYFGGNSGYSRKTEIKPIIVKVGIEVIESEDLLSNCDNRKLSKVSKFVPKYKV